MAPIQGHRGEWPRGRSQLGLLLCLAAVGWSKDAPGTVEESTTDADDVAEETTTESAENVLPDDTTVPVLHNDAPVENPGATPALTWLSLIGGSYYINLPATDNWSEFGPLRTQWRKLRLKEIPHVGQTSVVVDLHDYTYATSNGATSTGGWDLQEIEWGITTNCGPEDVQSEMRINLVGTPFRYDPVHAQAHGNKAHGTVECGPANKECSASCGGWCGSCGLGVAGDTETATLKVVDQVQYDAALQALLQAALEALKTTTVTRTEGPTASQTSTTNTTTQTTITDTATETTTTAVFLGLSKTKEEEGETGSHIFGTLVVLMLVAGFGICFALWVRKNGCPSWLRRAYGRFEDDVGAKASGATPGHKLPAHKLGGSRIPQV